MTQKRFTVLNGVLCAHQNLLEGWVFEISKSSITSQTGVEINSPERYASL